MNPQLLKSLALMGAMAIGIACPWLGKMAGELKYLIMLMLWLSFLGVKFHWTAFRRTHALLLVALFGLSTLAYWVLLPLGKEYAQIGWLLALTPTATAAPAVAEVLGGSVEYMALSVIFTHLAVGLSLPILLPLFARSPGVSLDVGHLLLPTMEVILVPLIIANLCRWLPKKGFEKLLKLKKLSFALWVVVLCLATAKGSEFFADQPKTSLGTLGIIFGIAAVVCLINFRLGRLLGLGKTPIESSQSLGQKNTVLAIWVALSFISPFVALGPICYILCHNAYNSWQILRYKKQ